MLNVNLTQLDNEGINFSGSVSPEQLNLDKVETINNDLEFNDIIEYNLHISAVSDGVLVAGTVSTFVQCNCGRCLEDYSHDINNLEICQFHEEVTGTILDIAPRLREDILISMPMKYTCKEDCEGIVTTIPKSKKEQKLEKEFEEQNNPWQGLDDIKL